MNLPTATRFEASAVDWPEAVPIDSPRILSGTPAASTVVIEDSPRYQLGLWQVSPGAFLTDHSGYAEYIHLLSGTGQLIDESGAVTELSPGVTVFMQAGWKGRWVVRETIIKVYTVVNS